MRKLLLVAVLLTTAAFVSPPWQGSAQTARGGSKTPPIVSTADAPAGTETLAVQWLRISVPDPGVMLAADARPPGPGPFPVVVVLHGTHGFAQEYVQWPRIWRAMASSPLRRVGFQEEAGAAHMR